MRIGYGRVSTRDRHPEAQHDVLTAAGCEQIVTGKTSGKLANRLELDKALLSASRAGDQPGAAAPQLLSPACSVETKPLSVPSRRPAKKST